MLVGRYFHEYPFKSGECQFTILIDFSGISPPAQNSALAVLNNVIQKQNLDRAEANYARAASDHASEKQNTNTSEGTSAANRNSGLS